MKTFLAVKFFHTKSTKNGTSAQQTSLCYNIIIVFRELLEMRLRLYLNQGLIYEDSGDIHSGKKFMEKALAIARFLLLLRLAL